MKSISTFSLPTCGKLSFNRVGFYPTSMLTGMATVLLTLCMPVHAKMLQTPAAAAPPTTFAEVGEFYQPGSRLALGYLSQKSTEIHHEDYPNGLKFIAPPPQKGSLEAQVDQSVYEKYQPLEGTDRWKLAQKDADLKSPAAVTAFSCALGVPISEAVTPHLAMLMARTLNDAALTGQSAKEHYQRVRPFRENGVESCTPKGDHKAKDDSYPSGHSAIGWAWALILSQIAPDRIEPLMARGYAYGESRLVCRMHWASDVEAGRLIGAAAVARLQTHDLFQTQLALAKQEVQQARAKGLKPNQDCRLEEKALQPL